MKFFPTTGRKWDPLSLSDSKRHEKDNLNLVFTCSAFLKACKPSEKIAVLYSTKLDNNLSTKSKYKMLYSESP